MSILFLLMFQFRGRCIAWKIGYANSISHLLKLRSICMSRKYPFFSMVYYIPNLKAWEQKIHFLHCLVILLSLVNLIDSCIQFTLVIEKESSLSFLDILLSKDIDQFSKTVFRKSYSISPPTSCPFLLNRK